MRSQPQTRGLPRTAENFKIEIFEARSRNCSNPIYVDAIEGHQTSYPHHTRLTMSHFAFVTRDLFYWLGCGNTSSNDRSGTWLKRIAVAIPHSREVCVLLVGEFFLFRRLPAFLFEDATLLPRSAVNLGWGLGPKSGVYLGTDSLEYACLDFDLHSSNSRRMDPCGLDWTSMAGRVAALWPGQLWSVGKSHFATVACGTLRLGPLFPAVAAWTLFARLSALGSSAGR